MSNGEGRGNATLGLRYLVEIWYENSFYLHKCKISQNRRAEVDLRRYRRHFRKSILRHNSVADRPIRTKFGKSAQNRMPMTTESSKSNQKLNFNMAAVCFEKRK